MEPGLFTVPLTIVPPYLLVPGSGGRVIKDTQMGMTWFVQLGERTLVCTLTGLWGCILGVKLSSVGAQRQVEGTRGGDQV